MRKVLIVSPHFPPINAADHQRVRMALPYLKENGWEATVLCVDPRFIEGMPLDPLLERTVPGVVQVIRTNALPYRITRLMALGNLAMRAWPYLRKEGDRLLAKSIANRKFDLVFISTTQFPVFALGPRWKKKFGAPYVLDFQDPWLSNYYGRNPATRPPGGKLKYGLSQLLARWLEPVTVRNAAQIVSVSKAYVEMLRTRYPDVSEEKFIVLPFGASEQDFVVLENLQVSQRAFDPKDGQQHWLYVGRGGQDMEFALRAFFLALKRHAAERPDVSDKLRVHFIGTDYAPKERARKTIEPLARELGVGELVIEETDRLPYFHTLRCLKDAQALFIPGSDDPGYTASKVYPYVLARKPLLAVFHRNSSVVDVLRTTGAGRVVTFGDDHNLNEVADEIYRQWFAQRPLPAPQTNWNAFSPYTAREMTRTLCDVFDRAVDGTFQASS
jgi:hypothetical protein